MLRPGRMRAGGVVALLLRIYRRLVESGLRFDMTLRADAGFSFPELYAVCEDLGIQYVIGLITHPGLERHLEPTMRRARSIARRDGTAKLITTSPSSGAGRLLTHGGSSPKPRSLHSAKTLAS